jgi:hypothetical protein
MTMTKKALAVVLAAGAAGAVAVPALTGAQASPGREITVRDKAQAAQFVHAKASTPDEVLDMGDRVVTRQALFDERDRPVGSLATDCVNVGAKAEVFKATLQCLSTYRLKGGEIVSAGVVTLTDPAARIAIVGGTGTYAGAGGDVRAGKPVKGYDTVDVLRITH